MRHRPLPRPARILRAFFGAVLVVPVAANAQAVTAGPCAGLAAASDSARSAGVIGGAADTLAIGASVRGGGDVRMLAEVSAREVRFARQPEIRVRLCGGVDSVRVVERRNLPTPVVVGATYRDVYVAFEILGRLHAECLAAVLRAAPADSTRGVGACASVELRGRSP